MSHDFESNSSLDTHTTHGITGSPGFFQSQRAIHFFYCMLKFIARKLPAKNYFITEITVVKYHCQIHKTIFFPDY